MTLWSFVRLVNPRLSYPQCWGKDELRKFLNLEKVIMLSVTATIMYFAYSLIALLLSIVKFASQTTFRGSLTGAKIRTNGISSSTKVRNASQALGNIAFTYTYALLLIEIQETLKSPPLENKKMKKANMYGLGATTVFYVSLGLVGYVAFGNGVPRNILTVFRKPFWLIDGANLVLSEEEQQRTFGMKTFIAYLVALLL
ncbi:hypothetical protein Syun_006857 [Stephania yunnanensis]|uniref:Amino acid transporter transmembrane domain-containing protein n=1 Tax=Stephania yunnanensis TaxID=152371 RepID=A0AAP0KXN6_9MAGN